MKATVSIDKQRKTIGQPGPCVNVDFFDVGWKVSLQDLLIAISAMLLCYEEVH